MIEVLVGNDIEQALKTFTNKIRKSGLLQELKERAAFESLSQKRRREKAESVRASRRRAVGKEREYFSGEARKTQQQFQKERREEAMRTMVLALPKGDAV